MSCLKNPNGRTSSTRPSEERPSVSRSVRSTVSPKRGDDTTPLLTHEASDFPVRNSRVPAVNEHTDGIPNEHYCCCCS